MITTDSPIVGKGSGVVVIPNEAKRKEDVYTFQDELIRLCRLVGFNEDILIAQSAHETANWTSHWWTEELNPAGIGIFDDGSTQRIAYKTGTDAARAQVVHMAAYVFGDDFPQMLKEYTRLDPRFRAVFEAGLAGSVRVLGDLGSGRWATDPNYATQIAAKANAMFQEVTTVPAAITFGKVPYPSVVQSHLPARNTYVVESGAPDIPDAVFWHRMVGTLKGTDGWFHAGNAATAYGVGVRETDGAALAGVIYEWIEPGNGWYGESSGPLKKPYGDGAVYANQVGVTSVNRRSKAIEISGDYDTPLDDAARDAIANMTAYWADQAKIPWDRFPLIADGSRSFVIWHNEITGTAYKMCPGGVVMQETPALIDRTKRVMRQYQESNPVPEYANPGPISWEIGTTGAITHNGVPGYAIRAEVFTTRNVVPMNNSTGAAKPTGPKIPKNTRLEVVGAYGDVVVTDALGRLPRNSVRVAGSNGFLPKPAKEV